MHDLAKVDTTITDPNGTTRCPGHEIIGASRVHLFSQRFDLDEPETKHVERLVRYHGFISEILNLILSNGNIKKYQDIFKSVVGDITIELLLFIYADLLGSDLASTSPQDYADRLKTIIRLLV